MKTLTLEETIQWMEECIFEGAVWNEDFWSNYTEALHYLKQFRKIVELDEGESAEVTQVSIITKPNLPLTWDELKQMDGKPIWISDFGWDIADGVGDDTLNTAFGISYKRVNMNTEWQAYRKEKE